MSPPAKRRRRPAGNLGALVDRHQHAAISPHRGGAQAAQLVADPRFRRRVQRFWPLGDRITAHLLAEIAVKHDCLGDVERFLDAAYEHKDAIQTFGIDRWPPLPLRAVSR